jgi:hypothetical protein
LTTPTLHWLRPTPLPISTPHPFALPTPFSSPPGPAGLSLMLNWPLPGAYTSLWASPPCILP